MAGWGGWGPAQMKFQKCRSLVGSAQLEFQNHFPSWSRADAQVELGFQTCFAVGKKTCIFGEENMCFR